MSVQKARWLPKQQHQQMNRSRIEKEKEGKKRNEIEIAYQQGRQ